MDDYASLYYITIYINIYIYIYMYKCLCIIMYTYTLTRCFQGGQVGLSWLVTEYIGYRVETFSSGPYAPGYPRKPRYQAGLVSVQSVHHPTSGDIIISYKYLNVMIKIPLPTPIYFLTWWFDKAWDFSWFLLDFVCKATNRLVEQSTYEASTSRFFFLNKWEIIGNNS